MNFKKFTDLKEVCEFESAPAKTGVSRHQNQSKAKTGTYLVSSWECKLLGFEVEVPNLDFVKS